MNSLRIDERGARIAKRLQSEAEYRTNIEKAVKVHLKDAWRN